MFFSQSISSRTVSVPEPPPAPTLPAHVVSTTVDLAHFLESLHPSSTLYLDLEGKDLSRHGTLTIITILVHPQNTVALIDVLTLGPAAFGTQSPPSTIRPRKTLKSILEDSSITKYLWDVRNDADALKALYDVGIEGVIDIQLLENATRYGSKTYLRGLNPCVQRDLKLPDRDLARWVRIKDQGSSCMESDPFSVRPLAPETLSYCVGDVEFLPQLRDTYMRRQTCTRARFEKVRAMSAARVREAHLPCYEPNGPEKRLGPWGHNEI